MKLFLRSLLFFMLLLAGYAQASPVQTGCIPKDILKEAAPVGYSAIHHHRLLQGHAPCSESNNAHHAIADPEVDDDEDESKAGKKNVANDRFSLIQSPAVAGIYNYNNRLPFCAHFSLPAACKFIFHCAIRI